MGTGLISEEPLFPRPSDYLQALADFGRREDPPSPHEPSEIWDHWVGIWQKRIRDRWDNVIQVTGPPRCGKSTLALRLARALDPTITHETVSRHLAGSADETVSLYRTLQPGQAGIYDESILGLQSTEFATAESRTLTQVLNTAGVRRITLFLLIPHRMDLNKAVRDRRVETWIKCSRNPRGRGYVHVRADLWDYDTPRWSGLKLQREWGPLSWKTLEKTRLWSAYESEKERRLQLQLDNALLAVRAENAPLEDFRAREELERRVAGLLDQGWTRRRIQEEIGVSPNTISRVSQRKQMERLKKFGYRGPPGDAKSSQPS